MCNNHRHRPRHILATAILTGLQEYNQSRQPPSSSYSSSRSFQEPMTQGVTYIPPQYTDAIDPNPPAYESLPFTNPTIIDEKRQLYRLSTEERVPPHVSEDYNPNTGLDSNSIPRFVPADTTTSPPLITLSPATTTATSFSSPTPPSESLNHLLSSIAQYFDTQIKLHSGHPATVRKLEYKKAKKLLKAEKKYNDHLSKGKDTKYEIKMEKRAERIEKWTGAMMEKSVGRHEKHVRKHGRCCEHASGQQQQTRTVEQ